MSQVRIIVAMALTNIQSGESSAGIVVSLTDASGAVQTSNIQTSHFPAPGSDGTFTVEADFTGVASGIFTGTVQSVDTNAQPLGAAVSFSDTASNLQPMPVSATVAFA